MRCRIALGSERLRSAGWGVFVGVAKREGGVESGGCGVKYPGVLFCWCISACFCGVWICRSVYRLLIGVCIFLRSVIVVERVDSCKRWQEQSMYGP